MSLKDIRPQKIYTVTIDGEEMKVKYSMNSKDYLERIYGDEQTAFEKVNCINPKAIDLKHFLRAFLLINYEENLEYMDNDDINKLKPSLSEIGEKVDFETMQAMSIELFNIALESLTVNTEVKELGESNALIETAVTAIGALSKLYGKSNLEKALKIFGYQPQQK